MILTPGTPEYAQLLMFPESFTIIIDLEIKRKKSRQKKENIILY
jgi:hypothetical protein